MVIEKAKEEGKDGLVVKGDKGALYVPASEKALIDFLMLLEGELGLENITEIIKKYGYHSVASYYNKRKRYTEMGLKGLSNEKRGPKHKSKRTADVEKKIVALRFQRPEINSISIAELLKKEGFDVSPRSVERTFKEYGISRKK